MRTNTGFSFAEKPGQHYESKSLLTTTADKRVSVRVDVPLRGTLLAHPRLNEHRRACLFPSPCFLTGCKQTTSLVRFFICGSTTPSVPTHLSLEVDGRVTSPLRARDIREAEAAVGFFWSTSHTKLGKQVWDRDVSRIDPCERFCLGPRHFTS